MEKKFKKMRFWFIFCIYGKVLILRILNLEIKSFVVTQRCSKVENVEHMLLMSTGEHIGLCLTRVRALQMFSPGLGLSLSFGTFHLSLCLRRISLDSRPAMTNLYYPFTVFLFI